MSRFTTTLFSLFIYTLWVAAYPRTLPTPAFTFSGEQAWNPALQRRGTPVFPSYPPSCPICAQNYSSINSCAQAAPVLANVSNILFNPGAFISVIRCACSDTFQATYPQCVDCFIRTNQTELLNCNTQDLPGVLQGMRQICAIESTLNANVSVNNGEVTPTYHPPQLPWQSSAARSISLGSSLLFIWALVGGAVVLMR